jgi:hypothetical protein
MKMKTIKSIPWGKINFEKSRYLLNLTYIQKAENYSKLELKL